MSFYLFRLETLAVKHKRGNIPDNDIVTFAVMINNQDRGHATGFFPAMVAGTVVTTDDITVDGFPAFPAGSLLNAFGNWTIGPLQTSGTDDVAVVYSGTNTSDSSLASLATQEQDELELKILNAVAKKFVGLIAGAGFGDDLGSALSEGFAKAFADPVGEFIGYERQGPCNGPVFVGVERYRGSDLNALAMVPLMYRLYGGTPYPRDITSAYPGVRVTRTHTDEASHDTEICGHAAETDVTFSIFRLPFLSMRSWLSTRFPHAAPATGIRRLRPQGGSFSIKSLLGVTA